MKVSITRKTFNLDKLIKKIEAIRNQEVKSGYFKSQGDHPEAEISYVDLAWMHAKGDGDFPERDVRIPTVLEMQGASVSNFFSKVTRDYLFKNVNLSQTLDKIGWKISDIAVSYFGIPSQYLPMNSAEWAKVKGGNTPLVFEGYLMDAWAWKTSYDNIVVEYKSSGVKI